MEKAGLVEGEISAVRIMGTSGGGTFKLSIARAPERARHTAPDIGPAEFRRLHPTGGEDEAGLELAHRRAAQHRELEFQSRDSLHHMATREPPGDYASPRPTIFVR